MPSPTNARPDPDRTGGPGWLARGGRLTTADRLRMLGGAGRTQLHWMIEHARRRRPSSLDVEEVLRLPDTPLVREAVDAAQGQGPVLVGHAHRTAVFARALALVDDADVDHELLHVASLLHDVGLAEVVTGEDFTRRSADVALDCAAAHDPAVGAALEDGIVVHTTIGITPARDGALGCYVQWGAMVDLVGLRERDLPYDLVRRTVADHPRTDFRRVLVGHVRAEARAVPGGRFALLRLTGFPLVVRAAPVPSRP